MVPWKQTTKSQDTEALLLSSSLATHTASAIRRNNNNPTKQIWK